MSRSRSSSTKSTSSPRRRFTLRGAHRAAPALAGWALALQLGGAIAAGSLGAQTCTCTSGPGPVPPVPPIPGDTTTPIAEQGGGGGSKPWWMLLLPAGAAGLFASLPGGGRVPAAAAPIVIESTGEVALPATPAPVIAPAPELTPIKPPVRSDTPIPVKKDPTKPDSTKRDSTAKDSSTIGARGENGKPGEPHVPAPFLLGGLGLGAGAWGLLLKKKLLAALTSLG